MMKLVMIRRCTNARGRTRPQEMTVLMRTARTRAVKRMPRRALRTRTAMQRTAAQRMTMAVRRTSPRTVAKRRTAQMA